MPENQIRFAVEKGFFVCENEVFNLPLGPIDKLCYLALVRYADTQKRAWPSYNRLASDVGVGKKRAIEAVKTLIECKLIKKKVRGNRTNIYLVYPARFFCAKKSSESSEEDLHNYGGQGTPQSNIGVSQEHPQGVQGTPSGCPTDTIRVSHEHPKSTSTSNCTSTLSSSEIEREDNLKQKNPEQEKQIKAINDIILQKGYQVTKRVIKDMLEQYSIEEVKAAIECTDFKKANNPLAVIFTLLKTGRFVIPRKEEPQKHQDQLIEQPDIDRDTLKNYLELIRETLKNDVIKLEIGAEQV